LALANIPTYMYSFNDDTGLAAGQCYQAAHGFELPFLFPGNKFSLRNITFFQET